MTDVLRKLVFHDAWAKRWRRAEEINSLLKTNAAVKEAAVKEAAEKDQLEELNSGFASGYGDMVCKLAASLLDCNELQFEGQTEHSNSQAV